MTMFTLLFLQNSSAPSVVATLKDWADFAESLVTIAAFVIGGYWTWTSFIKKRENFPRANVSLNITHQAIENGKIILHVEAKLTNTGGVLLYLASALVRIQQVSPTPRDILDKINSGLDPVKVGRSAIEWPLLKQKHRDWEEHDFEIEPGETDQYLCDFVLDGDAKLLRVYAHFRNEKKRVRVGETELKLTTEPHRDVGWQSVTFYDLRSSQPVRRGGTMTKQEETRGWEWNEGQQKIEPEPDSTKQQKQEPEPEPAKKEEK